MWETEHGAVGGGGGVPPHPTNHVPVARPKRQPNEEDGWVFFLVVVAMLWQPFTHFGLYHLLFEPPLGKHQPPMVNHQPPLV